LRVEKGRDAALFLSREFGDSPIGDDDTYTIGFVGAAWVF